MPWYSKRHVAISLTVLPGGEPAGNYRRNFAEYVSSSFEFGCAFRLIHAFDLKSPEREWG
jgi:hypothetical protein